MRNEIINNQKNYPRNILEDLGITEEPDAELEYNLRILTSPRGGCLTGDRTRILELFYKEGCSVEQTADRLQTSKGHIRRELHRIRHLLKKNILSIYFGPRRKYHYTKNDRVRGGLRRRYSFSLCPDELGGNLIYDDFPEDLFLSEWILPDEPELLICEGESIPIEDLELSVRSYNCLKRAGYNTAGSIARAGKSELSKVRNMGKKSLDEIERTLKSVGLVLEDYGI